MKTRPPCLRAAATVAVALVALLAPPASAGPTVADFAAAPLHFEENHGQAAPGVRYTARGPGYTVALRGDRATLTLATRRGAEASRIDVVVLGARADAPVEAAQPLPGRAHVYAGTDPAGWVTSIPLYGRVAYRGVYPGIDLIYYGAGRRLEYDFVVAPGADPGRIALGIQGADRLALDAGGDLLVTRGGRSLRMHRPVAYQESDGGRVAVDARFALDGARVAFVLGDYDRARPLVIDPVVSYATYIGGSIADFASVVALDSAGNAYIGGSTGAHAQHDSFVTKLSADGRTILYQTTLVGGSNVIAGIAVDGGGHVYVAGSVRLGSLFPRPFPVTADALQPTYGGECESFSLDGDGFVAKLAPGGTLAYASFLGGKCGDAATGIALDAAGNVYVAGYTEHAASFPTAGTQFADPGRGNAWAFVTKMPPDFSTYTYSALLGGTGAATAGVPGSQFAAAIAVDAAGAAYVTGSTDSVDFPTTDGVLQRRLAGHDDAFVTKLAPDGSRLLYSTYLGGATASDDPFSIAVDAAGHAYVGGSTSGTGFPGAGLRKGSTTTSRSYVAKISPDGRRLLYGAIVGAGQPTFGSAVAIDGSGHAYLAGATYAADFPAIDSPQACATSSGFGSNQDAFVLKLSQDGSWLHYSACFGGQGQDGASGLAVDGAGAAYVVGATNSSDFPTRNAAIPSRPAGSDNFRDGFAAKLGPFSAATNPTPTLRVAITGPAAGATLRDTAWVDVWVEGATGSANTFTLLVGDQTVGTQAISGVHATIPWDTRLTPDGTVTLSARVRDAAGNHGSTTRSFVLSNGARPGPAASPAMAPLTVRIVTPGADGMTVTTAFDVDAVVQNASTAAVTFELTIDGRLAARELSTRCCLSYRWDPATVANGSHTLVVTVRDGAGRTASDTRVVNVAGSTGAPLVPAFTAPGEGATVSGTVEIRTTISGAVGTPIHATLWLEGTVVFDVSNDSSSHVFLWDTTRLRDGTYTFTLWGEDTTFRRASAARTFRVANGGTPPPPPPPPPLTAAFTSPAEGATVSGTVTVGMSAAGTNGTPITFTLTVDGTQVFTTSGTATTASHAWNTGGVGNGAHTLGLTVRDGAGRTATATRTVTVSNATPPPPPGTIRVFITQPGEGATATGSVWFTIWVENAAAGTKTFTLSSGGVTGGSTTSTSNGPVTFTWDSRTVANGTQTVTAGVRDSAGNTGSATRTLNVSNAGGGTPPPLTASFTSPAEGATVSGTVTVGMSASGASGTPITFTLTVDGAQVFTTSGTASTASHAWNTGGAGDGTHTLGLTVRDGAGRTATATRTVTVSNAAPPPPPPGPIRVFITQPGADGATVRGTAWFTIWIENAAAGSKTYRLSVGGTVMATTATTSSGPVTIPWNTTSTPNGSRAVTVTVTDSAGATGSAVRTVNVAN